MAWPRRVPYEWILGALFLASFVAGRHVAAVTGRIIWLLAVAPPTGLALGEMPQPGVARSRLPRVAAALGWLWCGAVVLAIATLPTTIGETAASGLLWALPALAAASFVSISVAAFRPGRSSEAATSANSAFLLLVGFGFDVVSTPST